MQAAAANPGERMNPVLPQGPPGQRVGLTEAASPSYKEFGLPLGLKGMDAMLQKLCPLTKIGLRRTLLHSGTL